LTPAMRSPVACGTAREWLARVAGFSKSNMRIRFLKWRLANLAFLDHEHRLKETGDARCSFNDRIGLIEPIGSPD
jgi:hypothetical protein